MRRRLPGLTLLTAVWVAVWGLLVFHDRHPSSPVSRFDGHLEDAPHVWVRVASQLADLGDANRFKLIAAGVIVLCVLGRSARSLFATFSSLLVVVVVVEWVLKPLVDSRIGPYSSATYPSGHAATAACLGTMLILLLGRATGPLRLPKPFPVRLVAITVGLVAGPAVGLSMVVVGAHTIVDVIAGVPLGGILTLLTCAGVDRMWRLLPRRSRAPSGEEPSGLLPPQPQDGRYHGVARPVDQPGSDQVSPTVAHHP